MSSYSYVIAYREADSFRRRNLDYVLSWLASIQPTPEVIVIEQDAAPMLNSEQLPEFCRHQFAYNPGAFNKSWAYNLGADQATNEVLVFGDADMVIEPQLLLAAVELCEQEVEAVNPYQYLIEMTDDETSAVRAGMDPATIAREQSDLRKPRNDEQLCFCGGLFVVHRATYFELGGMDERFQGWGGEDNAMSIKLERLARHIADQSGQRAYHLWHPQPVDERLEHGHYGYHLKLVQAYLGADDSVLRQLIAKQRPLIADLNRYHTPKSP